MRTKMKIIGILSLVLFLSLSVTNLHAQGDEGEMMANIKETLDLSDTQVEQVSVVFKTFRGNVDNILLKYEGQEEPDMGAMVGEIRTERDNMNKGLQAVLSKNQFETYQAKLNEILTDMFNDLAEIRLIDLQPSMDLTDKQIVDLKPIIGKSMLQTVKLLFENAGTRLSLPKKVSLGNQMKKIEKEKRAGMENILTPAQMAAYDAYKEEQKNKK